MALLPTQGTYELQVGWLTPTPITGQSVVPRLASVTFGPGYVTINGTRTAYRSVWGNSGGGGVGTSGRYFKGVVLDCNGGFLVLADSAMNMGSYTWTYTANTAVIRGNFIASKQARPPYTGQDTFQFWIDNNNMIWDGKCFLTGTMISTSSGHVGVEDIKPGMELLTFDQEGHAVTKKVQWVGKEQVFRWHPDFDLEKAPVRIKKDAIAPNVPFKDCLLTPEHCLYLEGSFVPVRMLVNAKSIYYDRSVVEYEYFHVELEDHSILQSDGLFSESYLKTSDRDFSSFEGRLSIEDKTWEQDAAVPLNVNREFVEPLYQQFALRAEEMQIPCMERKVVTKSEVYLMDQEGNKIFASKVSGNKHVFHIENLFDSITIISDSASPSELIGPFVDDRRKFGLLIGEVTLLASDEMVKYTKHLEVEDISGWHVLDLAHGAHRWTDGRAEISGLGTHKNCSIHIEIKDQKPAVVRVGVGQDNAEISSVA